MESARRHEYLRTLGIDVWIPLCQSAGPHLSSGEATRALPDDAIPNLNRGIIVGPGAGNLLLVCANSNEAATVLAADIARCLDCEPVWSWPAPEDSDEGMALEQAIAERLFTRVLILGKELCESAIDPAARVLGSARLLQAESIPLLAAKAEARRALWSALTASNWCAPR
ncbi:MAG: hypothetical protein ACREO9_11565, partial [Lysobacterales bacterium]